MIFNSYVFLIFLACTFILYYLPALSRYQVVLLIVASLIFYSYSEPVLVLLLLFSVSINIVSSYYVVYGQPRFKKPAAIAGVSLNLLILIFFKYSSLLVGTFVTEPGSIGKFLLTMPLPIGISFFTFQGISLVVDVYREKYASNKTMVPESFLVHARQILFFKAFFPQLVSGPIVKAHDFIPQITEKKLRDVEWESFFKAIVIGYFLKMVVADNLKDFTFWITYPYFEMYSTLNLVVMLIGYSCQIFADFAGYSLIAIGIATLFGYHFKANFNFPYIASSFRDFWKRWHISLSSFLMEYLYIPLGGNKKGEVRTYLNLMIVMLLGGLWHGAAWSYALWGALHGFALAAERFFSHKVRLPDNKIINVFKILLVFSFVTMAWLLFKLPDINHIFGFVKSLSINTALPPNRAMIIYTLIYSAPVFVYHSLYLVRQTRFSNLIRSSEFVAYAGMIALIVLNSGSPGTFIYFQF